MAVDMTMETPIAAKPGALSLYLELSKARLASMVVLTAVVGYVLAARGGSTPLMLLVTGVGTALAAFGANIFNQVMEADRDRLMERTRNRPLPAGLVTRSTAVIWGWLSSIVGCVILWLGANLLTAALAAGIILLYTLVYTPMKVQSPANTIIGALCGALPPVMGWTAATGRIDAGGLVLGLILFVWQVPHFLALAWMYREDYARGGFRMLPAVDADGRLTSRSALLWAFLLAPLGLFTHLLGLSGTVFAAGSVMLALVFTLAAVPFVRRRSRATAKRVFLASVIYLPLVLGLMVGDMDERIWHLVTGVDTHADTRI
jgi:protoheme IX farnesyltransferase